MLLETASILALMAALAIVCRLALRRFGQATQRKRPALGKLCPEQERGTLSRGDAEPVQRRDTVPQIKPARAPPPAPKSAIIPCGPPP